MTRDVARRLTEGFLTFLAILSLWPWILGWPHPGWRIFMYAMLGAMALLFVANAVRLWRMRHSRPDNEEE